MEKCFIINTEDLLMFMKYIYHQTGFTHRTEIIGVAFMLSIYLAVCLRMKGPE